MLAAAIGAVLVSATHSPDSWARPATACVIERYGEEGGLVNPRAMAAGGMKEALQQRFPGIRAETHRPPRRGTLTWSEYLAALPCYEDKTGLRIKLTYWTRGAGYYLRADAEHEGHQWSVEMTRPDAIAYGRQIPFALWHEGRLTPEQLAPRYLQFSAIADGKELAAKLLTSGRDK